jgi:hypothetical protein
MFSIRLQSDLAVQTRTSALCLHTIGVQGYTESDSDADMEENTQSKENNPRKRKVQSVPKSGKKAKEAASCASKGKQPIRDKRKIAGH